MIAFLMAKSLFGAPRWLLGIIALAILASVVMIINNMIDTTVNTITETARDAGTATAVNKGHETTLKQIGEAHEKGNEVRDNVGLARYCECLRSATPDTSRNCVRYLPNKPVSGGSGDPLPACPG